MQKENVMKPVAICQNKEIFDHSTSWVYFWIDYCKKQNIPYEITNCYKSDFINYLDNYSAILWNYSNYVISDLLEARNVLRIAEEKGIYVFPDSNTGWHFDDKIAEKYAFEAVDAPTPRNWVFYTLKDCNDWLENEACYPIVGKLRCGSGSNNVHLLKNKNEAKKYAQRMFGKGFDPSPSLIYKAYSKAQSSKNLKMMISRIKRIPEFLLTRKHGKQMPVEKGYCYFQEFIPNDGFDLKIVVIGDKLSYIVRTTRKGDFRASGGGNLIYDRSYVSKQVIESAFESADKLRLQCVGFDYVIEKATGKGLIIEMCYGFDADAIKQAGGYWNRKGQWIDEPLNVPNEIIKNFMCSDKSFKR